jgi:hypothetical protein
LTTTITSKAKSDVSTSDDSRRDQALPNEILVPIFKILRFEEQLKTLADAARISKTIHDLVIPMLYEKIRFTADNQDQLIYGLTPAFEIEDYDKSDPSLHTDDQLSKAA